MMCCYCGTVICLPPEQIIDGELIPCPECGEDVEMGYLRGERSREGEEDEDDSE